MREAQSLGGDRQHAARSRVASLPGMYAPWQEASATDHRAEAVTRRGPELWGVAEIARELDIGRETVHHHIRRGGFPEPVARLAMGKVWLAQDVREWRRESRTRVSRASAQ